MEDTGVRIPTTSQGQNTRKKCGLSKPAQTQMSWREKHFLRKQMIEIAEWKPNNNDSRRAKRLVNIYASIGAAIGLLVNAGQIKKIKQNIKILQEATIPQGQKISELAKYADLTANRLRLHDSQIYDLQYGLLIVEDWIEEIIHISNFQVYSTYQVNVS